MEIKLPTVSEMFRVNRYSGPYARVILAMMQREAESRVGEHPLFAPWCALRADGVIDPTALKKLFADWSEEELCVAAASGKVVEKDPYQRTCFPIVPCHNDTDRFATAKMSEGEEPREQWRKAEGVRMPPRVFGRMADLPHESSWHPHHAAHNEGSVNLYGGWRSDVDQSATLHFPLLMGVDCTIRSGSRVTWSVLGHGVRISGRVSRSVIGDGTEIDTSAVVGDSIVGRNVKIGPGVVLHSSYTIEGEREEVVILDTRSTDMAAIRTGRKVVGSIVADGSRIFASLPPGMVVERGGYVTERMSGRLLPGIYSAEVLRAYDKALMQRDIFDLKAAIESVGASRR